MKIYPYERHGRIEILFDNKSEAVTFLKKFAHIDAPTLKVSFGRSTYDARYRFTPVGALDFVTGNRCIRKNDRVSLKIHKFFPEKYLRSLMGE